MPSFGTDSPLDLDIKERLMDQVLKVLPVCPDDELAYITNKKLIEDKKHKENKDSSKRRPLVNLPRSKSSTNVNKTNISQNISINSDESKTEDNTSVKNSESKDSEKSFDISQIERPKVVLTMEEKRIHIKSCLLIIYSEYSPDKLNKIDKLLEKYYGREDEFYEYVLNKYSVAIDPMKRIIEEIEEKLFNEKIVQLKKLDKKSTKNSFLPKTPNKNVIN